MWFAHFECVEWMILVNWINIFGKQRVEHIDDTFYICDGGICKGLMSHRIFQMFYLVLHTPTMPMQPKDHHKSIKYIGVSSLKATLRINNSYSFGMKESISWNSLRYWTPLSSVCVCVCVNGFDHIHLGWLVLCQFWNFLLISSNFFLSHWIHHKLLYTYCASFYFRIVVIYSSF